MFNQNRLDMGRASWKHLLTISISLTSFLFAQGQNNDCVTAQIICSDERVTFTPRGAGIQDFANPNNHPGCLKGGFDGFGTENQSAWYYFEFREDMPPNSVIEFTISPFLIPGRKSPDFDFAIFGPNLKCDSLGFPVRCSFANETCDLCPETGLGRGATDESEPALDQDGFVAPMIVQPGEGYYLVLDNFLGDATGFSLTWGGSAAPFLNCLANPVCRNKTVNAGPDLQFCQNPGSIQLNPTVKGVSSRTRYEWLGTPEALSYLSDKNVLKPIVTLPDNFSGSLDYIISFVDLDCVAADDIKVTVTQNASAQLRADTIICQGESTTISLTETYLSYRWSNGAITPTITVDSGGVYSVTVSNGDTCTSTAQITIIQSETPKPTIEGKDKLCTGELLTLHTSGAFNTYFWSNGDRDSMTTINRGGNYSITVTNAYGCRGTGSTTVTESPNPVPIIVGNSNICEGETATLATTESYIAYQWSTNDTTSTILARAGGSFVVTVTDANGCRGTDDFSIVQNQLPTLTVVGDRSLCESDTLQLTAQTNASNISWSTGATTPTIDVSTAGNYTVTVRNDAGCEKTETIPIQQQPKPQPFISDSITICPETGATLQAEGNFIQYRWSTGDTTAAIFVNQPGIYTLQVTNAFGCTGIATQTVDTFPSIQMPSISGDLAFCPDAGTTLRVTGNGNYVNYSWSNGATGDSIKVFDSNTYKVTVSDSNGCTSQASITVQAFVVNAPPSDTIEFCAGSIATIQPEGNFVTYSWSNGSTQPTLSVSEPAIFSVTVTDGNGCNSNATYTLIENQLPQVMIQGEPRFCKTETTQLTATPGFVTYSWSNNATTASITVGIPAVYRVIVTDENGCAGKDSTFVTELPLPTPKILGPESICPDQSATLRLQTAYPLYSWSDGSQDSILNINEGGTFAVTVTDENGCIGFTSTMVDTFAKPTVIITADTTLCEGSSTSLMATAGFTVYQWSNGGSKDSTTIHAAGTYSVTARDGNGCIASDDIIITAVTSPMADAGQAQTLDCTVKSVRIGTPAQHPYLFIWNGPGITAANANLPQPTVDQSGTYTLVVTDTLSQCESAATTVEVSDLSYIPQITLQLQDTLDCNTATVTLDAAGSQQGNGITYQWYNARREAITNETNLNLTTNQEGIYYFEIKDALTGCQAIDSIQVMADFDPAFVEAGPTQMLDCNNLVVTLSGSTSSEEDHILYKWMGPNGNKVSNLLITEVDQPGWYVLMVTNAKNGCSNMDSVLVNLDRTPPVVSAGSDKALDCTISTIELQGAVQANGATLSHTWKATHNYTFDDPTVLTQTINQPGIYILEAKNLQNGCSALDSIVITDNSDYPTDVTLDLTDPTCFGAKNGKIEIASVTGGNGPYFFSLNGSPMESVESFDSLGVGKYQLRIEDVAGCSYETEVALKEGTLLKVDLGKDTTIRFGARITLEPFVNVPTQTIIDLKWGGNTIENCYDNCWLQPVLARETGESTYTVTVTNEDGCTATDDIKVIVVSNRDVFIPNAFSPNGDGHNDVFMIYAGKEVASIKKLIIMNRWGNMVFQANNFRPNDPTRGWNGRLPEGNEFNPNVFVYYAEIEFYDSDKPVVYTGDVTVVK